MIHIIFALIGIITPPKNIIKDMAGHLPEDKRIAVANFTSMEKEETFLGAKLADMFTSALVRRVKHSEIIQREKAKKTIKEELRYVIDAVRPAELLERLNVDFFIQASYTVEGDTIFFPNGLVLIGSGLNNTACTIHSTRQFKMHISSSLKKLDIPMPSQRMLEKIDGYISEKKIGSAISLIENLLSGLEGVDRSDIEEYRLEIESKMRRIAGNLSIVRIGNPRFRGIKGRGLTESLDVKVIYSGQPVEGIFVHYSFDQGDGQLDKLVCTDKNGKACCCINKFLSSGEVKITASIKLPGSISEKSVFFKGNVILPRSELLFSVTGESSIRTQLSELLEDNNFPLTTGEASSLAPDISIDVRISGWADGGLGGIYFGHANAKANVKDIKSGNTLWTKSKPGYSEEAGKSRAISVAKSQAKRKLFNALLKKLKELFPE